MSRFFFTHFWNPTISRVTLNFQNIEAIMYLFSVAANKVPGSEKQQIKQTIMICLDRSQVQLGYFLNESLH